ncbi:MAG: endolytic transglycosylase MltG [SAR324 cluster bacterium]|nr:endolytic transglycosylase MltG [SAR324 cluster bacterium]MBL7034414.1 endolytic transglycosylase MltG [SAR324 cluster bacterium]
MKLFIIKNWKNLLGATLILGVSAMLALAAYLFNIYNSPIKSAAIEENSIILIPRGSTFDGVTLRIKAKGLLPHPRLYHYLAKKLKVHSRIQAGEFKLQHSWNTSELLQYLISGKSIRHRITIPEGENFAQIAERLHRADLADKEVVLSLKNDPHLLAKTGIPELTSLEGFLFPETYFFSRAETAADILSAMIAQYRRVFNADFRLRAKEIGMSEYEVLILASIVEKETGTDSDRPMIASVFHNRLQRKMRLDSDPTVIYGLSKFNGNLTRKHLRQPTPYNTYKKRGLTPTPISNPGLSSLHSVLYPADKKYLYFVARGDGSSQFSTTLREHNKAVWFYQKVRKNRQAMRRKAKKAAAAKL